MKRMRRWRVRVTGPGGNVYTRRVYAPDERTARTAAKLREGEQIIAIERFHQVGS